MVALRSCFPMLPHCLPAGNSGQQHLPDGSLPQCRHPLRHGTPGQQLRYGAPTSNKPHPAEKSTPVWLAIWHTWAGFANSQLRCATFINLYLYICAYPRYCHLGAAAQTDANLSAHLHRLPTPPPYLRPMRLLHGLGASIRWMIRLLPGRGAGIRWVIRLPPGQGAGIRWMMRMSPGRGRRCWMSGEVAAWPGAAFLQITARTNPCSRHLWGTLARAVASI